VQIVVSVSESQFLVYCAIRLYADKDIH